MENMQNIGNVNRIASASDFAPEKHFPRQDDDSFVDSLDDVLGSTSYGSVCPNSYEENLDSEEVISYESQENVDDFDAHVKYEDKQTVEDDRDHRVEEEEEDLHHKSYDNNQVETESVDEEEKDFDHESYDEKQGETEPEYSYSEANYEFNQDVPEEENIEHIQSQKYSENTKFDFSADQYNGSYENTASRSKGNSVASSPKKVTFNDNVEALGDEHIVRTPKSNSMLRALQRIAQQADKEKNRNKDPVIKVKKISTPYPKAARGNKPNLPRSPQFKSPVTKENAASSPKFVSPRRRTIVVKKDQEGRTIPEPPRLSLTEKSGTRNYSISSPRVKSSSPTKNQWSPKKFPVSPASSHKLQKTTTMSEMRHKMMEDFRYSSPRKERFVPRTTVPKPFSFLTNERAAFRSSSNATQSHDFFYRPFKALAMPNYENDPLFHGSKKLKEKHFTVPEPFHLSVYRKFARKKGQEVRDDSDVGRFRFRALPVPDFTYKPLCSACDIHLTVPFPFHLTLDDRLANRIVFHGTSRSNLLARVQVECQIQKSKSEKDLLKTMQSPQKSSVAPKLATTRRTPKKTPPRSPMPNGSKGKNFKARPMPNFSKPFSPSLTKKNLSANNSNGMRSPLTPPRPKSFKAKPMPNFSRPFSPTGNSVPSSPNTYDRRRGSNSRQTSPSPNIYASSPSPRRKNFMAKEMPDFSKPFVPMKSSSAPSTPTGSARRIVFKADDTKAFRAKPMPNFDKPFIPATSRSGSSTSSPMSVGSRASLGPMLTYSAPSTPTGLKSRSPLKLKSSEKSFNARRMPDFSKPFVPTPPSVHSVERRPLTPRAGSKPKEFKARPMPDFSKPFIPLKRSSIEEALVKVVEDQNILEILNRKLDEYKSKLDTDNDDVNNNAREQLKNMTDEVVHKVLRDFVNTAKASGVNAEVAKEFSYESLNDHSVDLSYAAIADDFKDNSTLSEDSKMEFNQLSESTLNDSDFSITSAVSQEEDSNDFNDQSLQNLHPSENVKMGENRQGEGIDQDTSTKTESVIFVDEVQDNEDSLLSHAEDAIHPEDCRDVSNLPPMNGETEACDTEDRATLRLKSVVDAESESINAPTDSCSVATGELSETAVPLMKVAQRLSETVKKLSELDEEIKRINEESNTESPPDTSNSDQVEADNAKNAEEENDNTDKEDDKLFIGNTCESIEVAGGGLCSQIFSPRGDFGDDFDEETDAFRSGWKRAPENMDLRDGPDNSIDDLSAKLADFKITEPEFTQTTDLALVKSPIEEKIVKKNVEQPTQSPDRKFFGNEFEVNNFIKKTNDKEVQKSATKRKDNMRTFFDRFINCCPGIQHVDELSSPKTLELNLLEDSRDDIEM